MLDLGNNHAFQKHCVIFKIQFLHFLGVLGVVNQADEERPQE